MESELNVTFVQYQSISPFLFFALRKFMVATSLNCFAICMYKIWHLDHIPDYLWKFNRIMHLYTSDH